MYILIIDSNGKRHKYAMIRYIFDGEEQEILIKPHGNAKSSVPFFRTSRIN